MPIYEYKNEKTGEIFEDMRTIANRDELFVAPDGTKCERVLFPTRFGYMGLVEKERESFQVDRDFVKEASPKYLKFRDGHKERYDPTKHC